MSIDSVPGEVEAYLERLRKALARRGPESDEIVAEIRAHILERLEAEGANLEGGIAGLLGEVGEPEALASEYGTDRLLRRASQSWSPWLLLRTTLRWARTGLGGFLVSVLALLGYGSGAVCLLSTVLKPLFPDQIGLWVAADRIVLGYWSGASGSEMYGISMRLFSAFALGTLGPTPGPAREVLGNWFYPTAWVAGVLLIGATTLLTRRAIGRFRRDGSPALRAADTRGAAVLQRGVARIPRA